MLVHKLSCTQTMLSQVIKLKTVAISYCKLFKLLSDIVFIKISMFVRLWYVCGSQSWKEIKY